MRVTEVRRDSLTASTIGIAITLIAAAYGLSVLSILVGPIAPSGGTPGAGIRTLDVAIALSLVVAGGMTLLGGGPWRVAVLAATCAIAWTGVVFVSEPAASGAVRAIARGLTPLWPVLVLHLVALATTRSRLDERRRTLLVGLYLGAWAIAVVSLLTYDPFFDPGCRGCRSVPAVLDVPAGVRSSLRQVTGIVGIVSGVALAWRSATDLRTARRTSDRMTLVGGVIGGLAIAGIVITAARSGSIGDLAIVVPADAAGAWLVGLLAVAMLTISAGIMAATIALVQVRVRLRRITDEIEEAPPPGTLETALGAALGDPTLRLGYRVAEDDRYVAPDGARFAAPAADGARHETPIRRGGTPVALVDHRADIDVDPLRELRPSLLIALDNERLRAASLAHLRELRVSRSRIVDVGDAERRRIERDLHDGAQQGLLAVAFDLRLAKHHAERDGDLDRARQLSAAEAVALAAVDELRRVARGVHPAVLSQAGLVAALHSLSDEAAIPMEVHADLPTRPPMATETAAYQVVSEALADAVGRGAHEIAVRIHKGAEGLLLEAVDDGATTAQPPIRIADRVGASGGDVSVGALPDGHGNVVSVSLPCA